MSSTKRNLIIIGTIVLIGLLFILFIIPDSFFLELHNRQNTPKLNIEEPSSTNQFTSYEEQIKKLKEKKYSYEYLLLDSMSSKTYRYDCNGTIDDDKESGKCTSPENITYNETNKADVYSNINTDFLDIDYIFEYISDIEPELTEYQTTREYNYLTKILDLETEITISTDRNNITQIVISNAYMTYLLNYEM